MNKIYIILEYGDIKTVFSNAEDAITYFNKQIDNCLISKDCISIKVMELDDEL